MSTKATVEDVKRLAGLARVEVSEEELASFATEFDSILAYVGKLDELELADSDRVLVPVRNVLRADEGAYLPGTWTKAITDQFPTKEGNSLSVKKILSHD